MIRPIQISLCLFTAVPALVGQLADLNIRIYTSAVWALKQSGTPRALAAVEAFEKGKN